MQPAGAIYSHHRRCKHLGSSSRYNLSAKCRVRRVQFRWVKAESSDELTQLTHTIDQRIARYLERQGFLVRDAENSSLTCDGED